MSVIKRDNFKQKNPVDQARRLLSAMRVDLYDMKKGVGESHLQIQRMSEAAAQIDGILKQLPKWER